MYNNYMDAFFAKFWKIATYVIGKCKYIAKILISMNEILTLMTVISQIKPLAHLLHCTLINKSNKLCPKYNLE